MKCTIAPSDGPWPGGEALDLRWAQLSIGGADHQAELEAGGGGASGRGQPGAILSLSAHFH
jgi:hypothetical protein